MLEDFQRWSKILKAWESFWRSLKILSNQKEFNSIQFIQKESSNLENYSRANFRIQVVQTQWSWGLKTIFLWGIFYNDFTTFHFWIRNEAIEYVFPSLSKATLTILAQKRSFSEILRDHATWIFGHSWSEWNNCISIKSSPQKLSTFSPIKKQEPVSPPKKAPIVANIVMPA